VLPIVVLSGGLATRMKPFTENIPKSMIDVAGKPFIHWQLKMFKDKGIKDVILCVGHLGEMIEEYVGNGADYGLHLTYSYDGDKLLGTGGAIRKVGDNLPESFFIQYGDSYLEISYTQVADAFRNSGKTGLMTVYKNDDLYDSSNVVFENGNLLSYSKKNKTQQMHYIDYGLGILRKDAFDDFQDREVFDLADVYERLATDEQLFGYEVYNRFYEIGSHDGLMELRDRIGVPIRE